jgi:hypothetical protein
MRALGAKASLCSSCQWWPCRPPLLALPLRDSPPFCIVRASMNAEKAVHSSQPPTTVCFKTLRPPNISVDPQPAQRLPHRVLRRELFWKCSPRSRSW